VGASFSRKSGLDRKADGGCGEITHASSAWEGGGGGGGARWGLASRCPPAGG
jgi:hypothetical protein